ncbi:hypothetical protein NGM10_04360 [Halorussus salilacus]|uniref:hypothetical protein n=1 Tax=Halorussus salilacus TaxID=2953750 RepID=UPI0020A0EDD5|nr:hypothetical protein [Halorussus salilacus]USZ68974.1 hypothetical protein NGM10_04360 [Halorussus salilacus]
MRRRDILRKCGGAAALGGLGFLAGCTGGGAEDEASADLGVESFDPRENDDGKLVVAVTVRNDGDAEGTGYLYVTVEAGEDISRESAELTVEPGETATADLEFTFDYETFDRGGSIETDLRDE